MPRRSDVSPVFLILLSLFCYVLQLCGMYCVLRYNFVCCLLSVVCVILCWWRFYLADIPVSQGQAEKNDLLRLVS